MTQIRIAGLTKSYGDTRALSDVDLEIHSGELFFLLGPSGCGKSTLLRTIAGLQSPSAGQILFDGRDVTNVPTQERNAVMCFQGYALWPHMTVRENVRFGLSVRETRSGRDAQRAQVEKALEIVQMTGPLADRKPQELSGGQQQRVALARALAVEPACLLLDEPLSNLDTHLRQELRREIQRICRRAGITTVYVTHDQKEALSTADRIAVMRDGRLVQVGTPQELYRSPVDAFVAEFMGPTNLLEGEVVSAGDGLMRVATGVGEIVATAPGAAGPAAVAGPVAAAGASGRVTVSIRPELIRIVPLEVVRAGVAGRLPTASAPVLAGKPGQVNHLVGRLVEDTFLGQSSEHSVAVGNSHLSVVSAPPQYGLAGTVALEFDAVDVVVLAR